MADERLFGIDLGCSGSRITVVCPTPTGRPSNHPDPLVGAIPTRPPERFNNTLVDFPAHGYPLDDDAPAYDPSVRRRQFEPVALKYGFYLLARELDKAAMQHPIAKDLSFYDCPELQGKFYSGLVALFRSTRARMDAMVPALWGPALTDNRTNDQICVTLPGQWNSAFKEVYLNVLADAFNIHRKVVDKHVTFITESDAWAHMRLGPGSGGHHYREDHDEEVVLILDFGGHMMVRWINLLRAPGGGELLMHYLLEHADDLFLSQTGRTLSPREKSGIRDYFANLMMHLGPSSSNNAQWTTTYELQVITDTGGRVRIDISRAAACHFWECAYRHPLKVVAQQFGLLKRIVEDCKVATSVLISGGSLENDNLYSPLHRCLKQLAEDAGLKDLQFWRNDQSPVFYSAIRGALAAKEYALTAEQFVTQGIGIGLQRKLPGALEWEHEAPIVLYFDVVAQEYRQYKYTRARPEVEGTQFRLLCDPLYHLKAERIPIGRFRFYVLFDGLPKALKRDKYKCEVSIDGSGENTFMVVKIQQTGHLRTTHITNLRLRLRFDLGPKRAEANIEPVKIDEDVERMEDGA
ncbi:hypothetical protein B0T13DRAFT_486935 [Neurospora crassa]|nr:hypothetical protein B0T13DRAFT_486935 [Neurospora crassa]